MENEELIERVLEAHEVCVAITGACENTKYVTVAVPDLRSAPRSVWGDWGPMYTVALPADRPIEISVRSPGQPPSSHSPLDVGKLKVDSPMLGVIREQTPLVMRLPLPEQGFDLHVFYDTQGRPSRANVTSRAKAAGIRARYDAVLVEESEPSAGAMAFGTGRRSGFGIGADRAAE